MAAINDNWLMNAAHLWHSTGASQPIVDHFTSSCQGVLGPVCDHCKGKSFNLGHLHVNGVTSLIKGDGGDDWHLVLSNSTRLATIVFSAQVSINQLHLSTQYIGLLSFTHCLHNLVVKQPCTTVVYAQLSHQVE